MLAETTNVDIALIFAMLLFFAGGIVSLMHKAYEEALISFGLIAFALAFIITP